MCNLFKHTFQNIDFVTANKSLGWWFGSESQAEDQRETRGWIGGRQLETVKAKDFIKGSIRGWLLW